jgi:NAD(P)-dependent dehydrogenase (short-subunit alcohol dehydrogenase family)
MSSDAAAAPPKAARRFAGWSLVLGGLGYMLAMLCAPLASMHLLGAGVDTQAIDAIRMHDPDLAQQIADLMFVFDDVMKLDDKALQLVLKEVASETLIVALKGAAPALRDKFLANMSSRAALGKELRTAYAATKAGLIGMTRVWALELGAHGITANAIGPGPIRTELFDRANPPDAPRTRAIIESVPVRRIGTPEDVAHAASYLLDARSGFVTGQVLYVCGGMTVGVAGV